MARHFPDDLVQTQCDWLRTYEELARHPATGTTALRRRLIDLSCRLDRHPFWTAADRPSASRVGLRDRALARLRSRAT